MTSPNPPRSGLDDVRRATAYPRMLTAARMYAAAMAGLLLTACIITATSVNIWTYALSAVSLLAWVVGAMLARGAFQALERELGANPRSPAVIASFQDLFRFDRPPTA
jgi:hypothetical protein